MSERRIWSTDHDRGHEQNLGIVVWSERDKDSGLTRVTLRLRAVTEVA